MGIQVSRFAKFRDRPLTLELPISTYVSRFQLVLPATLRARELNLVSGVR